jgi:hypothetical protein
MSSEPEAPSADKGKPKVPRSALALLALLVIAGAVIRIAYNDVAAYSPADERQYTDYARHFADQGFGSYPEVVRDYLDNPWRWDFPNPLRWGHFLLSSGACLLRSPCDARSLAWLSTVSGIAAIPLTFLVGLELVGVWAAVGGAALVVTSPLELAMGRRALQDEVFCAVVLLALWALLRALRREGEPCGGRRFAVAGALMTLAFAVKEAFLFTAFPAFVVLVAARIRERGYKLRASDVLVLVVPALAHVAGFMIFTRSFTMFFDVVGRLGPAAMNNAYAAQYTAGPAHVALLDFFILSPVVSVGAFAALAIMLYRPAEAGRGAARLGLVFVSATVAALLVSNNVRYDIVLDPLMRLMVAVTIIDHFFGPRGLHPAYYAAALGANALVELPIFQRVFVHNAVYDPTTYDLLRALDAIPRF